METPEKVIVATLIAEFVNELTFIPETNRRFRQDEITAPYQSDYEAEVAVKIGNTVKEIKLHIHKEYHSSEGEWQTPEYKESWTELIPKLTRGSMAQFDGMTEAGVDIDFSDIISQYTAMVEEAKKHEEQIKKDKLVALDKDRRKKYKTSWPVTLQNTIDIDRNKTIIAERENLTITPVTEDEYAENGWYWAKIAYKGFQTKLEICDGKYEWQGAHEDKGVINEEGKKVMDYARLNDNKKKRAAHPAVAIRKYLEEVNEYISNREYRKNRSNKEYLARRKEVKMLEKACGFPVATNSERKYSRDHRGRSNNSSWMVYTYLVVTKLSDSGYSSNSGITINTESEKEYKDGEYNEVPNTRTYTIGGFRNLDLEQFKGILTLLLKGKKVITVTKANNKASGAEF